MKKLLIIMGLIGVFISTNVKAIEKPTVTEHEKVTIYIFRGDGCQHCQHALKYFNELKGEYNDYFNVIAYETWKNPANETLFTAVKEELDISEKGVPFILIGDNYHLVGFDDIYADEIIEAALKNYESAEYVDIVQKVITKKSGDYKKETLKEACEAENIVYLGTDAKTNNSDVYIILGIFAVIIGGVGYLIITSNKKS